MADFKQAALNRIRLDCCEQHCFDIDDLTIEQIKTGLARKIVCKNCGGDMPILEANQYVRGFAAAGGDPCEVWANWIDPGEEVHTKCPNCFGETSLCSLCGASGFVSLGIARIFLKGYDEC